MDSRVKISDVMTRVRACVEVGNYFDTYHSTLRQGERNISRAEILYVLKHGWHEKSKDRFDLRHSEWNYAVRGIRSMVWSCVSWWHLICPVCLSSRL